VRAKTLFASTRATLVRELGSEKFAETIFATDEEEVLGEKAWRDREDEKNGSSTSGGFRREDLMGEKERELEAVRQAEEAARSGTPGRDIGIGGTFARGPSRMRIEMHVDEEAKSALESLQQGGLVQVVSGLFRQYHFLSQFDHANGFILGCLIQAIDVPTETLKLAAAESGVDAESVQKHIPSSSPRYTFYHYPDSDAVIFIYTCPSGSSIRERMLYASSRNHALQVAEAQGLKVSKKVWRISNT
jgi:twinfilin-like protein